MIPYSRRKLSDLYTLSQSKLLENHTLIPRYSPYYGSTLPPAELPVMDTFSLRLIRHLSILTLNCSMTLACYGVRLAFCFYPALVKKLLGPVEMTFGLVHASFSLPNWQAVKMIFFAP